MRAIWFVSLVFLVCVVSLVDSPRPTMAAGQEVVSAQENRAPGTLIWEVDFYAGLEYPFNASIVTSGQRLVAVGDGIGFFSVDAQLTHPRRGWSYEGAGSSLAAAEGQAFVSGFAQGSTTPGYIRAHDVHTGELR